MAEIDEGIPVEVSAPDEWKTGKRFGPTFGEELSAAGVSGIGWGDDGVISGVSVLSDAQRKTLDAIVAAHNSAATINSVEQLRKAFDAELTRKGSPFRAFIETYLEDRKAADASFSKAAFIARCRNKIDA